MTLTPEDIDRDDGVLEIDVPNCPVTLTVADAALHEVKVFVEYGDLPGFDFRFEPGPEALDEQAGRIVRAAADHIEESDLEIDPVWVDELHDMAFDLSQGYREGVFPVD